MTMPPLMFNASPVVWEAAADERKSTASATSSTSWKRPRGIAETQLALISSRSWWVIDGDHVVLLLLQLGVDEARAHAVDAHVRAASNAAVCVRLMTPAFDAQYGAM